MKIHITKNGETVEQVASKYSVSSQDLIGINPHINLTSDLVTGLKLKIPDVIRAEKANDHIEKFYPHLEQEHKSKEQAVPVGLKPLPALNPEVPVSTASEPHTKQQQHQQQQHQQQQHQHQQMPHMHHAPEHTTPWSHLHEHTAHFNPQQHQHHPWNPGYHTFNPYDTRLIVPPLPFYPPYPLPYGYPPYGYGFPLPLPGFGPGAGFGPGHGHGFGPGWHGGGHFGGHH